MVRDHTSKPPPKPLQQCAKRSNGINFGTLQSSLMIPRAFSHQNACLSEGTQHRTVLGRRIKEYAMFDELAGRINATTLRLKQAHAMLNLFETDFGRPAVTLEEIKEWAYAQEDEQLRSRVDQLLSN